MHCKLFDEVQEFSPLQTLRSRECNWRIELASSLSCITLAKLNASSNRRTDRVGSAPRKAPGDLPNEPAPPPQPDLLTN
ncbi:unnamed protein product [Euphydryas editha]|uniref:Uncharacterized protein n=1 Tax=Euphydryas editha TaxID=104508 RepID=A0AAU9V710_EUPED|nr:unnamed protein product [Euphydryas editha]